MQTTIIGQGITNNEQRKWIMPFVAALFAMLCLQMSNLGFSPLLPAIQKEFKLTFSQLGFFTGMYGIIAIILSIPAGLAVKKFGEKKVLIGATLVVILGLQLLAQTTDYNFALVGRAVWISGYRFAFICILTAIALHAPSSLKGRSMGIVGAVSSLASVIGAPLAGGLAKNFGWRYGFMGYIVTDLIGLLIIIFFYRSASQGEVGSMHDLGEKSMDASKTPNAFKMPIVWALAFLVAMMGMAALTVTYYVPSAAKANFGMDSVGTGWIISTGYLCAIFVNLLYGFLMDKYNKWYVMGSLALIVIPSVCFLASADVTIFKLAAIMTLAFGFTSTNQVYSIAGEVLKGREMGNVMGVMSLVAGIFGYLGPQMLGILKDSTKGFNAGWYMIASIVTIALIEIIWLSKFRNSDVGFRK